jgi:hypothetical protein
MTNPLTPKGKPSRAGLVVGIRLAAHILARADACMDHVALLLPGSSGSRADVLREAIVRGLADIERSQRRSAKAETSSATSAGEP